MFVVVHVAAALAFALLPVGLGPKAKKREGKQAVEILFVLNFGRRSGLGHRGPGHANTTVDRLAFRRGSISQKCARR
jgi:hypothetical protein